MIVKKHFFLEKGDFFDFGKIEKKFVKLLKIIGKKISKLVFN